MYNKNFSVSSAALNTNAVQTIDTFLQMPYSGLGVTQSTIYYPRKVQIINKTGADVNMNIFSNSGEINDYAKSGTNYELFTIQNNTTVVMTTVDILPYSHRMVFQMPTGSATTSLIVQCICYQPQV
jgi:hypothetical protein